MPIEAKFNEAVQEWKEHCKRNSHHSMPMPFLDCDAYRTLISMGKEILPFVRDELSKAYETELRYKNELSKLKIKVFGTDSVKLFDDNYEKICEDEEYQDYAERYGKEVIGNPGNLWRFVIQEIVPEFHIAVGKKGSNSAVESVAEDFVGIDVHKVQEETIKWLDLYL